MTPPTVPLKITVGITPAQRRWLERKMAEGYKLSSFIRALIERERQKEERP